MVIATAQIGAVGARSDFGASVARLGGGEDWLVCEELIPQHGVSSPVTFEMTPAQFNTEIGIVVVSRIHLLSRQIENLVEI